MGWRIIRTIIFRMPLGSSKSSSQWHFHSCFLPYQLAGTRGSFLMIIGGKLKSDCDYWPVRIAVSRYLIRWLLFPFFRWWIAYRDAMSFRASHYFVSYVGEASAVAAGFGASSKEGAPITKSSSTGESYVRGLLFTFLPQLRNNLTENLTKLSQILH